MILKETEVCSISGIKGWPVANNCNVVLAATTAKIIYNYKHLFFCSYFKNMMAQSPSCIVLVAALHLGTLFYCSAENVYCVTPMARSCSSCPHNSTHCATLSEYAQEGELYCTSDTTVVFLPGNHVLDVNITVASSAKRGGAIFTSDSTIICSTHQTTLSTIRQRGVAQSLHLTTLYLALISLVNNSVGAGGAKCVFHNTVVGFNGANNFT